MAAQVKLVRRRDFGSDISSLSLFNYEDGFSLTRNGWIQAAAGGDDRVSEAMTLHVKASSHDDLAAKLGLLDDKIREVGWYNDAADLYSVWLRAQMPDESGARQALVTGMRCEPGVSFYAPPAAPGNWLREGYNLALERMPWWESTSSRVYGAVGVNCLGGTYDYTTYGGSPGAVAGNEPARIAHMALNGASGGGGPLDEFWIGFRTDRFGDRANFVPVWECELGSYSSPTHYDTELVDGVGGVDASGGAKLKCTFDTQAGLKPRMTLAVEDITTNYIDQRGSYHVLCRARVTAAGTTCRVRLLDGFSSADDWRTQSRVIVSSEDWKLYALGTIIIPPSRGRSTSGFLRKFALRIEAERTAGSDDLEMDCFVPIPSAEGALHVKGGVVQYVLGDSRPVYVKMHPNGEIDGWAYTGGYPIKSVAPELTKYGLPIGAGLVVLAGQRETQHYLDDYVSLSLQIYNRWRTLRGIE